MYFVHTVNMARACACGVSRSCTAVTFHEPKTLDIMLHSIVHQIVQTWTLPSPSLSPVFAHYFST